MPFALTEDRDLLAAALEEFDQGYHDDFVATRKWAKRYLNCATTDIDQPVRELAHCLHTSLTNWGAGRRAAPILRPPGEIKQSLEIEDLREKLKQIAERGVEHLGFANNTRIIHTMPNEADLEDWIRALDETLLTTMKALGQNLFTQPATNVTYPMKALLLITGHMPAFDGQVRRGLSKARWLRHPPTQYLIPQNCDEPNAQQILFLPFHLGELWRQTKGEFATALNEARRNEIAEEPGRVFDILFFMQGSNPETFGTLLKWHPPKGF